MKFEPKILSIRDLFLMQNKIDYPIYQRTDDVWDLNKRRLLIDSILRGIDIPKLYYFVNEDGTYDVIDGHQRTAAIILFLSNEFALSGGTYFRNLSIDEKKKIEEYKLTLSIITDASEDDLRDLFLRLQLGVPTNSAEKLRAIRSNMGDFVEKLANLPFVQKTSVTKRRYGKVQLCAQICINSVNRAQFKEFSNAKYEDLRDFYRENANFSEDNQDAKRIVSTLTKMDEIFGYEASYFSSRANTVSAYVLIEEIIGTKDFDAKTVKNFFIKFLNELHREVQMGIHAKNEILLNYNTRIIQAADTRASIDIRNNILKELYDYFKQTNKIKFKNL